MLRALAENDKTEAGAQAAAAYGLAKTSPWAWRAMSEHALDAGDWPAALALVTGALERKIISPLVAERATAALNAAEAAGLEADPAADAKARERAVELAAAASGRGRFHPRGGDRRALAGRPQPRRPRRPAHRGGVLEGQPHPALDRRGGT